MAGRRVLYIMLVCMMLSGITGCGRDKEILSGAEEAARTEISAEAQTASQEYGTDYREYYIPEDIYSAPNIAQLTEEALYFTCGDIDYQHFYKLPLTGEALQAEKLPVSLSGSVKKRGFWVCQGQREGYLLCTEDWKEKIFQLSAYDKEWELLWQRDITKAVPEEDNEIRDMAQDAEGNIYLMGCRSVLAFDGEGQSVGTIVLPYESLQRLVIGGDGKAYVVSCGEFVQNIGKYVWNLDELLPGEPAYRNNRIIYGAFPVAGQKTGICYFDAYTGTLCETDTETGDRREIFAYADYDIPYGEVAAYLITEDMVRLVLWKGQQPENPFGVYTLTKQPVSEKRTAEKQRITILTKGNASNLESFAYAFNRGNQEYRIVIEMLDRAGQYEEDQLLEKMNARLAAGDVDMLYLRQQDFCIYKEQRVFEDLTPYLENSSVSAKDYQAELLQGYMYGQELYAIPVEFTLRGYVLKKSRMGEAAIQNTEDFITYLEQNPDLKWQWGGSSMWVLETCMRFGWDAYVDLEKGSCSFDGIEFQDLMRRIKALHLDMEWYDSQWEQLIESGENVMPEVQLYYFMQFAAMEDYFGDALVWIGYPDGSGEPAACAEPSPVLCLTANGKRKEGAFAFWQYYMEAEDRKPRTSDTGGPFPTKSSELQKRFADACTKRYRMEEDGSLTLDDYGERIEAFADQATYGSKTGGYLALNERQQEEVLRAMRHIRTDSAEGRVILGMITEEMDSYLRDMKTLQEATDILQSRVRLYLNERRKR